MIGARVFWLIAKLPRSVNDRLILRMPRHARPSEEIANGVPVREESFGGVACTWLAPELREQGVIVYLHGGSYVAGPMASQWAWLAQMQQRTGLAAVVVLYRMAPEHPFPTALDDALAAIRAMTSAGQLVAGRWVLAGDSAGGGLALATAQALCVAGDPLPTGLALCAPWVDLAMEHPDLLVGAPKELVMGRSILRPSAERYANGVDLHDPRVSPLFGPMDGLPPTHLDIGTQDLFLRDVQRLRTAIEAAGVSVTMIEQEGAGHTYPHQLATAQAEWANRSLATWIENLLTDRAN